MKYLKLRKSVMNTGRRLKARLLATGLSGVTVFAQFKRLSITVICLSLLFGCSATPVRSAVAAPIKCDMPTTDDKTVTGLAVVAVEMRQALEECNKRNGH